jgi:hypothetical protein
VPVEAYNNIGKVERYHALLRRVYEIIRNKLQNNTSAELALQIVVKTINDSIGPDGIIPTEQELRLELWGPQKVFMFIV